MAFSLKISIQMGPVREQRNRSNWDSARLPWQPEPASRSAELPQRRLGPSHHVSLHRPSPSQKLWSSPPTRRNTLLKQQRDRQNSESSHQGGDVMAKAARKSKAKTTRTRRAGKRGSTMKRKTAPARHKTATRRGKSPPVKKATRGRAIATKGKRAAPKRTAAPPAAGLAATPDKQMAETEAAAPAASSAPNPVTTEAPAEAQ